MLEPMPEGAKALWSVEVAVAGLRQLQVTFRGFASATHMLESMSPRELDAFHALSNEARELCYAIADFLDADPIGN
jgi:hypothetical protein